MSRTCRSSSRLDSKRTDGRSLELGRDRAPQPRGGSNGYAFKRLGLSVWGSGTTRKEFGGKEFDGKVVYNQRLLEWLEAENVELRGSVIELVLQIQALREGTKTPSA
jgi:hypothetical protein